MPNEKTHYRMPAWIWALPPSVLNGEDKRFLAYIWWCGFETCHCHNWYLALKFGFKKRTIQLRISKLNRLKFIAIGSPNSHMRTIFPRALKDHRQWLLARSGFDKRTIRKPFSSKSRHPRKKNVTKGRKSLRP